MAPKTKTDTFREHFAERAKDYEARLVQRFASLKDGQYIHWLEWSDTAFRDGARLRVARDIATSGEDADARSVLAYATREALNAARYPNHSTSACANLAHQEIGAAWAEALESLQA